MASKKDIIRGMTYKGIQKEIADIEKEKNKLGEINTSTHERLNALKAAEKKLSEDTVNLEKQALRSAKSRVKQSNYFFYSGFARCPNGGKLSGSQPSGAESLVSMKSISSFLMLSFVTPAIFFQSSEVKTSFSRS